MPKKNAQKVIERMKLDNAVRRLTYWEQGKLVDEDRQLLVDYAIEKLKEEKKDGT